jgi:flagellar biosynthesis protein FlhG
MGPRVISVCSGKGGVGKTNVVANLALALTQSQKRIVVLDADLGLGNVNVLLGLTPQYTVEHFIKGEKNLSDITMMGPGGMMILPASSGIQELVTLKDHQKMSLLEELDLLPQIPDIFLIDTGSGISSNVLYFNMLAEESIVLVTPELPSITSAYALIKILLTRHKKRHFWLLINQVANSSQAIELFTQISKLVDHSLAGLSIDYLGFIPFDPRLPVAVKKQRLVLEMDPEAPSSCSFRAVAKTLGEIRSSKGINGNVQLFLRHSHNSGTPI